MSYSSLTDVVILSPNCDAPRNDEIRKITIHHMAGNLSAVRCGHTFESEDRQASANYGIDSNGVVGCYVEEENRAWTSSSPDNDNQAITIEVANDEYGGDWHVCDIAFNKLIDLCVDICQRNGIKRLNYTGDASGNLTMHCFFAPTACPGPYLKSRFPDIERLVNERLGAIEDSDNNEKTDDSSTYEWSDEQAEGYVNGLYEGLLRRGYGAGENQALIDALKVSMTRVEAFNIIRDSDECKKKTLIVQCYLAMRGSMPSNEEVDQWFNLSEEEIISGILYSDECNNHYGI